MWDLCIGQLAELVGGRLRLATLPPLGGLLEPIGELVFDSRQARQGSLFWAADDRSPGESCGFAAEAAYAERATGAVVSRRRLEPWAGCFSLEVESCDAALGRLAAWGRSQLDARGAQLIAVVGQGAGPAVRAIRSIVAAAGREVCVAPTLPNWRQAAAWLAGLSGSRADQILWLEPEVFFQEFVNSPISHVCDPDIAVITSLSIDRAHRDANQRCPIQSTIPPLALLQRAKSVIAAGEDPLDRLPVQLESKLRMRTGPDESDVLVELIKQGINQLLRRESPELVGRTNGSPKSYDSQG